MSSSTGYARLIAGFVLPYGLVEWVRRKRARQQSAIDNARADAFKRTFADLARPAPAPYSRSAAISFLSGLGCDRRQVEAGSMPESSLSYSCQQLQQHLPDRPIVGLHVGNFVGVSLCHYTDFARRLDSSSVVLSIDPNLPHRGVRNPQEKVISCLNYFGLQRNAMLLTGFSMEKNASNDGVKITPDYDPSVEFGTEMSCEDQLPMLSRLMPNTFDFVVIDGNHEAHYLSKETALASRLLKSGGIIVMDDVDWASLGDVYRGLDKTLFEDLGFDGRVGLAKKK